MAPIRTAIRVEGIVQGVGFRPFVYTLATGLGLSGFVGNDVDGVFVEVEGPQPAVADRLLAPQTPRIDTLEPWPIRSRFSPNGCAMPSRRRSVRTSATPTR